MISNIANNHNNSQSKNSQEEKDNLSALLQEAREETKNPPEFFDLFIPGEIRSFKELTNADMHVYATIRSHWKKMGYCWATNNTISERSNLSIRQVKYSIKKLESLKIIITQYFNCERINFRRIWNPVAYNNSEIQNIFSGAEIAPPRANFARGSSASSINNIDIKNLKKEYKENTPKGPPPQVSLTNEEKEKLEKEFGKGNVEKTIIHMNNYIVNSTRPKIAKNGYKDYYKALWNWLDRDRDKENGFKPKPRIDQIPKEKLDDKTSKKVDLMVENHAYIEKLKRYLSIHAPNFDTSDWDMPYSKPLEHFYFTQRNSRCEFEYPLDREDFKWQMRRKYQELTGIVIPEDALK